MHSILFSILLASTLVSAIPMPLTALYENQPEGTVEKANHAAFTVSLAEANRQIGNMQTVLNNPDDPRIKTAFGPNANHAEIKNVVNKLASEKLRVQSMDPALADQQARRPVIAFVPGVGQSARFGSGFFAANTKQQAGTIIHEATHQRAGTGDLFDKTTKRIIPAAQPNPNNAQEKGYSGGLNPPTASNLSPEYKKIRDTASNMHQNADSYRVFASLYSRSLYKRALLEDDPVGYYLSKRSQCKLPPDHFAKKAATKGTTTVANKGATSPAHANEETRTAKATGNKGAKDLKGAATKAKGVKTVRKGTFTRKATGAMAGKGMKTIKGTKAKGVKTAKGAKTVKGLKASKGLEAVKGAKASKGVKAVKATKVGKGLKVAKGVNAAKGAKGTKGAAASTSVKAVKAARGPKSTATLKTASVAKTVTKVSTKAPSKKGKNLRRDLGISIDELE